MTWIALAPLALLAGTVVHEAAHALAVVADGGRVVGWRVLPVVGAGGISFGELRHDGAASPWLVGLAPTLLWIAVAAAAALLAARTRRPALARALVILLVILPMIDVSMAFAGLFLGAPGSDLYRALHGHETWAGIAMALTLPGFGLLAWDRLRAAGARADAGHRFAATYAAALTAPWLLLLVT